MHVVSAIILPLSLLTVIPMLPPSLLPSTVRRTRTMLHRRPPLCSLAEIASRGLSSSSRSRNRNLNLHTNYSRERHNKVNNYAFGLVFCLAMVMGGTCAVVMARCDDSMDDYESAVLEQTLYSPTSTVPVGPSQAQETKYTL